LSYPTDQADPTDPTDQTNKPANPPKQITLDFTQFPEIYDNVMDQARQVLRPPEFQALYMIREFRQGTER
jgi:hypothetical protein